MTTNLSPDGSGPVPLTVELARITGLLLVVLLPVHIATVLLVEPAEVVALVERWRHTGWLLADWGFLTLATVHALLSLGPRLLAGAAPSTTVEPDGSSWSDAEVFGRVAFALVVGGTAVLYLAASWAILRLV